MFGCFFLIVQKWQMKWNVNGNFNDPSLSSVCDWCVDFHLVICVYQIALNELLEILWYSIFKWHFDNLVSHAHDVKKKYYFISYMNGFTYGSSYTLMITTKK